MSIPISIILIVTPWKVCQDTDQGDWNNIVGGLPRVGRPSQRMADAKKSKMMMMTTTTAMMMMMMMMIMIMIMMIMIMIFSLRLKRYICTDHEYDGEAEHVEACPLGTNPMAPRDNQPVKHAIRLCSNDRRVFSLPN